MSHLENASLKLESTVDHSHHLQPVAIAYLSGMQLGQERQDLLVLSNLCAEFSGGVPLLLLCWQATIRFPETRNLERSLEKISNFDEWMNLCCSPLFQQIPSLLHSIIPDGIC